MTKRERYYHWKIGYIKKINAGTVPWPKIVTLPLSEQSIRALDIGQPSFLSEPFFKMGPPPGKDLTHMII